MKKLILSTILYFKVKSLSIVCSFILATTLIIVIGSVSSILEKEITATRAYEVGWSADIAIINIHDEEITDFIKSYNNLEYDMYYQIGYVTNSNLSGHTIVQCSDEKAFTWTLNSLVEGDLPKEFNQVLLPLGYHDNQGSNYKIGDVVDLSISINDIVTKYSFIVSGTYEKKMSNDYRVFVSSKFLSSEVLSLKDIKVTSVGLFKFDNHKDIINFVTDIKIKRSIDDNRIFINELTNNDNNMNMILIILVGSICILSIIIVSNVFLLTRSNDINYFGKLKILGMSNQKIYHIQFIQMHLLYLVGYVIGVISSIFVIKAVLEVIPKVLNITSLEYELHINSILIAFVLTYFVMLISSISPIRFITKSSPIDTLVYNDNVKGKKKSKHLNNRNIVFSYLLASKRKLIPIILLLSISVSLFSMIFSLIQSIDVVGYIEESMKVDILVANKSFINNNYKNLDNVTIENENIENFNNWVGIIDGGGVYVEIIKHKIPSDKINHYKTIVGGTETSNEMYMISYLYGLDDFILNKTKILSGQIDYKLYSSGDYILVDTFGESPEDQSLYEVGDQVTVETEEGMVKTYEVMAIIDIPSNLTARSHPVGSINFFLPSQEFLNMSGLENYLVYAYNIEENYTELWDSRLEILLGSEENSNIGYESKKVMQDELEKMLDIFKSVGYSISLFLGIIGIVSLITNRIVAIKNRMIDFAIFHSLGIQKREILRNLVIESVSITGVSLVIHFVSGRAFISFAKMILSNNIWFLTNGNTMLPELVIAPIFLIIATVTPLIAFMIIAKKISTASLSKE